LTRVSSRRRRRLLSLLAVCAAVSSCAAALPGAAGAAPTVGINAAGIPSGPALDEALATGAREVRMFLLWRDLEPAAKGRFAPGLVQAYADLVARLSAAGVRANFVFTTAPQWASGSANAHVPPRDPADYADALARFAALPGIAGHGIAYEIWNEQDADEWWAPKADPIAYAALLKAAAPALRAADPGAQVVLGPLTGADFPWLERLYAQGVQGSFDAVAAHLDTACLVTGPATFFRDAAGRISQYVFLGVREILATMRAHGDAGKGLRITEYGWSSTQPASGGGPSCERGSSTGLKPSGVTPAEQATLLAQGYHCLAQEPGIEAATWFTLRDAPTSESPLDELRHYGLLTTGGGHKPAWDAFRAIATSGDALSGLCGDFAGPSITVVTPKVGQRYAGSLLISASASDGGGPRRITFAADGKVLQNFGDGLANGKVVSLDWQGARGLSLGTHTITVSATDAQGNESRQDVQVRKVSPTELVAIGPAKFALKGVRCSARGRCTLTGRLLSPSGSPMPGKVQVQWQWRTKATKKAKARWKTLHKVTKPAGKPFAVRQQLRRSGSWRVRVRYLAPKPLKASSSPWGYFSAKAKAKKKR
jgi:polysaccharide biosynthesis protein PslG